VVAISEPDGAFYRDVTPGHYAVTIDSYIDSYINQFASIDLAAEHGDYGEVLSMRPSRRSQCGFTRDMFYTRLIPADLARDAIARSPFHGGG
jgi:hypothetical protein